MEESPLTSTEVHEVILNCVLDLLRTMPKARFGEDVPIPLSESLFRGVVRAGGQELEDGTARFMGRRYRKVDRMIDSNVKMEDNDAESSSQLRV